MYSLNFWLFAVFIVGNLAIQRITKYNTRYCISIPHYLNIMGPMHQDYNVKTKQDITDVPYEIPKYIYKTVFSQNLSSKKKK